MAELADAYGLGPYGEILKGSSPFPSIFLFFLRLLGAFLSFVLVGYSGLCPLAVFLSKQNTKNHPKIL